MDTFLGVILVCTKGCAEKPPGLYCAVCTSLLSKYEELEWVIGQEGQLSKTRRDEISNSRQC